MLTLMALVSGCVRTTVQELTPAALPRQSAPRRSMRVTLQSGAKFTVLDPWIANDSLLWVYGGVVTDPPTNVVGVPVSQVAKVESRELDIGRTAYVVLIGVVTLVFVDHFSGPGGCGCLAR